MAIIIPGQAVYRLAHGIEIKTALISLHIEY
jgi:hypothetical protein